MTKIKKISVIGLGYIGLPTAAIFASRKYDVVGVDIDQEVVETINRGEVHIVEPDLDGIVRAAVTEGFLRATTNAEPADVFLIAVPTPFYGADRCPDLSYIEQATNVIAPILAPGNLVILESTCPVGTTETIAEWLSEARPDLTFPKTHGADSQIRIAHCPERVLPGRVMHELVVNDRLIGGMTPRCSALAVSLYESFVTGECVIASNPRIAELTKLSENSYRDVNIAFANELSMICDDLGLDVWEVIRLANLHPRVNILRPGPGVGGHCIAVDPWFIVSSAPGKSPLIHTARKVNDSKPHHVVQKLAKQLEGKIRQSVICLGLTFKPNIDDIRESPSLAIVKDICTTNLAEIMVCEPHIRALPPELQQNGVTFIDFDSLASAIDASSIVLFLVNHEAFKFITKEMLEAKIVIDACGIFERA